MTPGILDLRAAWTAEVDAIVRYLAPTWNWEWNDSTDYVSEFGIHYRNALGVTIPERRTILISFPAHRLKGPQALDELRETVRHECAHARLIDRIGDDGHQRDGIHGPQWRVEASACGAEPWYK